jgi:DNA-binding SARP family transcriptional activator/tetratricopeptide (TPR) repeat protein
LRLNTLGGIRVVADGNVVAGAAAQPRRLAVLALLARAGRAGMTREKILAMLWPDEPEDRARRSLNQAIYSLRRDLGGDDALLGTKDVRLKVDLIQIDVIEFDDAIRAGDLDRAVGLFGGPFLYGFFFPRSSEFERWVEGERASLAHDYASALERVASLAMQRGQPAAAVVHWRRLAAIDPLNARVALSVMNALVAVGDVGGAVQHARLHEALLDQELGLPPDKEVAAFARQLRARSDAPPALGPTRDASAGVAPAAVESSRADVEPAELTPGEPPVAPPTAPDADPAAVGIGSFARRSWTRPGATLALLAAVAIGAAGIVAIVRARSAGQRSTSHPVVAVGSINDYASRDSSGIGRALRDMLATNLARSPDLTVVSASRLLEVERQMSGGRPAAAGAIVPVARQAGATTLVDGALYRLGGDTLRLDLRVTSLRDGNVLRAYTVAGHDAFTLADSATVHLVQFLGSTAPRGSVADATTRSVTAYRLYEEGLRSYYLGDLQSSGRLFEAALGEDSTFAMAAYYHALASNTTRAERLRRLRRAVALAARASDRERLIIEGGWALTNNSPGLQAIAETLATRYPTEVEGHYYLGRALVNAGSFLDAIAPLRRVEVMDSLTLRGGSARCDACDALHQEIAAYMLADSMAAAERVARRWLAARPNDWTPHNVLGGILISMNRMDAATVEFRTADSLDVLGSSWEPMATLRTREGDFARADEMLRTEIAKGSDATEAHWFLAISLRYQGRLAEALGEARAFRRGARLDRVPPGAADPAALHEAQVLREMGRFREAAALFDSISRFTVVGTDSSAVESSRAWSLSHEAGALAAAGDTSRLASLADTIEVYGAKSNLGRDNRLHHHVRGLLLAARGDDSTAVTEFRHAIFSVPLGYTRTNVEMARALMRLGRYGEAVAILEPALRGSLEAANLYATHPEIRLLLAVAYAGSGQPDRANKELDWVRRAWQRADATLRPQLDAADRAVARLR